MVVAMTLSREPALNVEVIEIQTSADPAVLEVEGCRRLPESGRRGSQERPCTTRQKRVQIMIFYQSEAGWLAKAQATARVDVLTAPRDLSLFFY